MLPVTTKEELESHVSSARAEVWAAVDRLTNACQDCYLAGDYPAAQRIAIICAALWDLVKPVPNE